MNSKDKEQEALLNRLKRIEGQVKGIQRMIENKKYCGDILTQIAAAKAALEKVGGIVLEEHLKTCIKEAVEEKNDENVNELIKIMLKFMK
ncbi:metal-sensitive transcriptional regulator [Garciella nitratireducens]|uniref:DNA-binding transcriptional regulator, FrmR family n=1 Tax=Garciella nitratireducens DSM 15102 TaxID=1121911 RepID=A0A1T4K0J8_9FIRM|nr:metal-sensitive transcriptional regulator [Garciella nitratireducens]RBP39212.1 DNA-binding FrmR family transcriptional regulator [Garciella nitratireducens]SJZ36032.1 DNA-binding transcriptional regulator, FrmR family [Garciella nitratireducens DSM 15102]